MTQAPAVSMAERARLSREEELPHLARFQRFHAGLPAATRRGAFHMFFTSGLLHWVRHAESFVPSSTELVLVGSNLTPDECAWIDANLDRPFHHIPLPVDDVTVWQFLFATCEENFGWLDIDCFVLEPSLFDEIARVPADASMNCTWSWDSGQGFPLANTHFLQLNADAVRAVAALGVTPNPSTFGWDHSHRPFRQRECFMDVPSPRERELLLGLLPPGEDGNPALGADTYFNTLVLYQLLARVAGYRANPIRGLQRRYGAPEDPQDPDPTHWPEDVSEELFHLFGVSYYANSCHEPGIRALFLSAEFAMLDDTVARLPDTYAVRHAELAGELTDLGVGPGGARELFRRHLVRSRRVSEETASRILTVST